MADTTNTTAASGAASLGPMNDRAVKDAIRGAYDLGYEDARKARNLFPEDVDEGNRGREVEQDHGGALIHTLARRLAAPAAQEAEPAVLPVAAKTHGAWDGLESLDDLPDGTELYVHPPRPQAYAGAPTTEAAYAMGAKGGTASDDERRAFEAWMSGHCWALCATWDGKGYRSDAEQAGELDPRAMRTRQLWAAWRDRSALAAAPQAPAAPDMESVLIDGVAYQTPAPVAAELLRLHLEAMESPAAGAAPTDAEIDAFREAFDWEGYTDPRVAQRAFGRAVLARWGAAAPAQEAEDAALDAMVAKAWGRFEAEMQRHKDAARARQEGGT